MSCVPSPVKKHAYLFLVYRHTYVLEKALELIDDERNDIYFHVDSKAKGWDKEKIGKLVTKSNIYYTERTDVNWAAFSQLNAILLLCKTAYENEQAYAYYHLMSESCLPIKSQDYIHALMADETCDYVTYGNYIPKRWSKYYYLFTETPKYRTSKAVKFLSRYVFLYPQKWLHKDRWKGVVNKEGKPLQPVWGWTWFSLRNQTVAFLTEQYAFIRLHFRNSHAPDETCISTMLHNFYEDENTVGSLRNITLVGGKPTVLTVDDYERLVNCEDIIARKFDENADKAVIDKLFEFVKNGE